MATLLDAGFLQYFLPFLSFIIIFVLLYSVLQKSKILGDNPIFNFIICLFISIITMFSGKGMVFIETIIPWYVMLLVAVFLIVLVSSSLLKEGISDVPGLKGVVITLSLIIVVWSITAIFGPVFTPYSPGADPSWEALRTIFHPRILGAVLMLWIIASTIRTVVENS